MSNANPVKHELSEPDCLEERPVLESPVRVLVVCRSPELRIYIQKGLAHGNLDSYTVTSLEEAGQLLESESPFQAVLVELDDPLPDDSAAQLNRFCKNLAPLPVIAVTPKPSPELVRDAMVRGVRDFLTNPFDRRSIAEGVIKAIPKPGQNGEAASGREPQEVRPAAPGERSQPEARKKRASSGGGTIIITKNPKMLRILEILDRVGPTDATVLIQGESGTGKEIIAKRIHSLGKRANGPFVEVNCGAIPANLLESQLFGHEKGSFTGAVHRQVGLFEIANQGTIFLDEIAEMSLDMQVKLLRVLQERSFRRIGGSQSLQVDVRVIAATNRDLDCEVEQDRFRADLFYRLNVISVSLPPLRDRLEDIPELVEYFCERLHREKELPRKRFHPDALKQLQQIRWVGNVRELENVVERLVLLSPSVEIGPADLKEHNPVSSATIDSPFVPTMALDEVKKIHISNVLRENAGNKMKTARVLGINVKTLYNLIDRLGIQV
ncbi:MAG: sigma-54-dependent Fis family transcriptional regulator [Planctomycetes bacterium]|nr:sigma-54-dependent Fis family transcriptional regulator [Planctomycetota bacterium]